MSRPKWTEHRYSRQRDCRCAHCVEPTLFPVAQEPARMAARPAVARYTRVTPKTRTLCHDCIRDIHERGVAVAPPPRVVRWRRATADGSQFLCEQHKNARQENE